VVEQATTVPPWNDGTTSITLSPTELLTRLATLVPAPHKNLLRYFGVLAPSHPCHGTLFACLGADERKLSFSQALMVTLMPLMSVVGCVGSPASRAVHIGFLTALYVSSCVVAGCDSELYTTRDVSQAMVCNPELANNDPDPSAVLASL